MSAGSELDRLLARRVIVLDGAMGTMLAQLDFDERACRGGRFAAHDVNLRGNYDVLTLTRPDAVMAIHRAYLAAGADMIETNTFNANALSQADYGLASCVYEINREAARLARASADACTSQDRTRPRFVVGAVGPTNHRISTSPRPRGSSLRTVTFDEMTSAYVDQMHGLLDGGVDVLLVETVVDTLGAQAAVAALERAQAGRTSKTPLMLSATLTDDSGRMFDGRALEAFCDAMRDATPWSVGVNCCASGGRILRPALEILSARADAWTTACPNAGSSVDDRLEHGPNEHAACLRDLAEAGLVNIVGGCCGTTPEHVRALAAAVDGVRPRATVRVAPTRLDTERFTC